MAKIDNSDRVGPRRPAPRRRKTSGGRGRSVRAVDTVALMDALRIEKPILDSIGAHASLLGAQMAIGKVTIR